MENPKWTPGPWRVSENTRRDRNYVYREVYSAKSAFWVAKVQAFDPTSVSPEPMECQANTHLIAAAPDEDAALLSLRNEVAGILGMEEDAIRAVIGNTNMACLKRRMDQADAALAKARGEA